MVLAPFDRRPGIVLGHAFDSETGSLVRKDVFPSCRPWIAQNQGSTSPFDTGELGLLSFDPVSGYPLGLPAGKSVATLVLRDILENWDGASQTGDGSPLWDGGAWEILWDGQGTVSAQFSCPFTSSSSGQLSVTLTPGAGGVLVKIEASDPTNPVRNIRMVRQADLGSYLHEPWREVTLERGRLVSRVRTLNLSRTNYSLLTAWANRAQRSYYTWTTYERGGWPCEVQIDLANRLRRDLWLSIPHGATDAFVTSLAELVKERLDPRLVWYVELSNENWNATFKNEPITGHAGQALFFEQQGAAAGLDEGGSQPFTGAARYHGRRVRQVMQLVSGVFAGQMQRIQRVFGGWLNSGAGFFWTEVGLEFEDAYQHLDLAAAAPYPGNTLTGLGSLTEAQMLAAVRGDLPAKYRDMRDFRALVQGLGLEPIGYEGGQHLAESGLTKAQYAVINAAQKTAGMRRLTRDIHGETQYRWGAGSATAYSERTKWDRSGAFGHWQDETESEKGLGLRAVAAGGTGGLRTQRGVASIGASSKTATITINAVDTAHAFARVTNVHFCSTGPAAGTTVGKNLVDLGVTIELTNETTLTLVRETAGESVDYWVTWEVVQYEGNPGGKNEFTVRRQAISDLPIGTTELRVSLANEIDQLGRAVAVLGALSSDAATLTGWDSHLCTVDIDQATRELVIRRPASVCRTRVSWTVVEFVGSNWTVARWTHQFAAVNVVETVTHPTRDWSKSLTLHSHRVPAGETALEDLGVLVIPNTTSQTLTARLRIGADNVAGGYHLVGFSLLNPDWTVYHYSSLVDGGAFSSLDTLKDRLFPAQSNQDRVMVSASADCAGTGTAHPTGTWQYRARTNQSVRFERTRSGQAGDWAAQIAVLPDPNLAELTADLEISFSGTAQLTGTLELAGTGGVSFGGTASISALLEASGAGGLSFGGSGNLTDGNAATAELVGSGGIQWGGVGLLTDGAAPFVPIQPAAVPPPAPLEGPVDTALAGLAGGLPLRFGTDGAVGALPATEPLGGLLGLELPDQATSTDVEQPWVRVGGRKVEGFETLEIRRSLLECCASWTLTASSQGRRPLKLGAEIELGLGDTAILEGYVNDFESSVEPAARSISYAGRDRTQDLVDCSTLVEPWEWANLDARDLAILLAFNFGLPVDQIGPADMIGPRFPRFVVQPGETAFAAIERAARQRGLLVMSDGRRQVQLVRPGSRQAEVSLVMGFNIRSSRLRSTDRSRYRRIVVRGQSAGIKPWIEGDGDTGEDEPEEYLHPEAEATDMQAREVRTLLVLAEAQADPATCQARANWEATYRQAQATSYVVEVKGWRQKPDGPVWEPGLSVWIEDVSQGIRGPMVLSEVILQFDSAGRYESQLKFARADAFQPQPESDPETEPVQDWLAELPPATPSSEASS